MKSGIILFFLLFHFVGFAQTDGFEGVDNTKGFNDHRLFKMLKGNFGVYPMKVYASFEYEKDAQKFNFFFNNNGKFYMEEDEDDVYDSVRYSYEIKEQKGEIRYKIYSLANELVFTLDNVKYENSLIDGGCDMVIRGLDYQYKNIGNKEFLFLTFAENIRLCINNDPRKKCITLKKGGFIIFEIDANTLKLK